MKNKVYETYLREPVMYNGKEVKFYVILHWLHRNNHGANIGFLKEYNINYVNTIDDLPPGAGAFSVGYDVDLEDLKKIREKNIPFIENSCPRIKKLREQLLSGNPDTHQFVFMILEYHLVYDCFKSAFPEDIIIIDAGNYQEELKKHRNIKPVHLFVYGVFRPNEVQAVIDFINIHYGNPKNILNSYDETRCCWTKQGLLEEIQTAVEAEDLDEVWVICSNELDTSTQGIIKEVHENGAKAVIIQSETDIPTDISTNSRIGVLVAPMPVASRINGLVGVIRDKYAAKV